jgi:hypothetical protein
MAKFCINCGNKMEDTHRVCSNCGTPDQQMMQISNQQQNISPEYQTYYQNQRQMPMNNQQVVVSGVQVGWVVLGFLVPFVGWILAGVWSNTKPDTAKACGIAGTIGFFINLYIYLS